LLPSKGKKKTETEYAASILPAIRLSGDLAFGLTINGRVLLDSSGNYTPPPYQQACTASQTFRYLNSDLHYNSADVGVLLRALHDNHTAKRESFFNEVRTCRRRVQRDWKETAVAPVLSQQDEFTWLEFHAVISAIRSRIRAHRMRLLDAFRAFDYNRDGSLSCSEMWGGLEWLGMKLQPHDIHSIVRHMDTYKDGRVRFVDWEAALKDPDFDEDEVVEDGGAFNQTDVEIVPKPMDELFVSQVDLVSRKEEIHDKALKELKIKVKEVNNWTRVWSSEGSGARTQKMNFDDHVSIWLPQSVKHAVFGRNK